MIRMYDDSFNALVGIAMLIVCLGSLIFYIKI
jgi:hypothetical protein